MNQKLLFWEDVRMMNKVLFEKENLKIIIDKFQNIIYRQKIWGGKIRFCGCKNKLRAG